MEIGSDIELYETDRPKILTVCGRLREHVGKWRRKDEFVREVMERFAEAGYLVDVKVTTTVSGVNEIYYPEVTISGRVAPESEYDHERQQHEVRAAAGVGPAPVGLWTPKGSG